MKREFLLTWALILLLAGLMFTGVSLSRFSPDESQWIYTTRYLALLAHGDSDSPEWDSYWTATQPPLARYVMGASLALAGEHLTSLNGPWDFSQEAQANREEGNGPSPSVLFWARLPVSLFASASVVLLFLIGRRAGGTTAGLGAAFWFSANPRSRELMTRAEADGILICLVLLALWLSIRLSAECEQSERRGARWRRPLLLTMLTGAVLGLAWATKLTGSLALLAFALTLLGDAVVRGFFDGVLSRFRQRSALLRRVLAALATVVGAGSIALLVFVLVNPALYSHPFQGTRDLFVFRSHEMAQQMVTYPQAAVPPGVPRFALAAQRALFTFGLLPASLDATGFSTPQNPLDWLPIDALVVAIGLALATRSVARAWSHLLARAGSKFWRRVSFVRIAPPPGLGAKGICLLWTAIFYLGVAANLGLDWDRYVLPLTTFAALWAGLGLQQIASWVARQVGTSITRPGAVRAT